VGSFAKNPARVLSCFGEAAAGGYDGYGCFCGVFTEEEPRGTDKPVDAIDSCCMAHKKCWAGVTPRKGPLSCAPRPFHFSCEAEREVTCSACEEGLPCAPAKCCGCDAALGECIAAATSSGYGYNPEFMRYREPGQLVCGPPITAGERGTGMVGQRKLLIKIPKVQDPQAEHVARKRRKAIRAAKDEVEKKQEAIRAAKDEVKKKQEAIRAAKDEVKKKQEAIRAAKDEVKKKQEAACAKKEKEEKEACDAQGLAKLAIGCGTPQRKEEGPQHFPVTPPKSGIDQCHDGISKELEDRLKRQNSMDSGGDEFEGPGTCLTYANGTRAGRRSPECIRDSRQGEPGACPDRAWVTVASRKRDVKMALAMIRSLRTVSTCADVVILAWEEALNLSTHDSNLIRILNVQFVETWQPIVEADIPCSSYLFKEVKKYWDFTRLMPYTLLQYKLVIVLDADLMFRENVDELLFQPRGLHSNGPWSPFNAGLFSVEPSCKVRDFLVNTVREADFDPKRKWKSLLSHFYAVETMQGLMYWYTHFHDKSFHVVDRVVYNYQKPTEANWERAKIVHFTMCGKPGPGVPRPAKHQICQLFHKEYQTMVWQNAIESDVVIKDHIQVCCKLRKKMLKTLCNCAYAIARWERDKITHNLSCSAASS